jgi:hypothetical protein
MVEAPGYIFNKNVDTRISVITEDRSNVKNSVLKL